MQQYFCMCTARIWDRWLILTFGALGCCLLFGLGSFLFFHFPCSLARCFSFIYLFIYFTLFPTHTCPCTLSRFFFSSLVPLPGVVSFIYLFISHYSQLIHALVLSLVSFFLPFFPCRVLFPLFIYLPLFPNSYMPLYSLYFPL
jgi:hypothetical protein